MTIIKFINFRFYVNGVLVSDECAQRRLARKQAAEVRLSIMRQARAYRLILSAMPE